MRQKFFIFFIITLFVLFLNANNVKAETNKIDAYIKDMTNFYQKLTTCSQASYNSGSSVWKIMGIKNNKCRYSVYSDNQLSLDCYLPLSYAKSYGTNKVNELKKGQIRMNTNDGFNNYCKQIN